MRTKLRFSAKRLTAVIATLAIAAGSIIVAQPASAVTLQTTDPTANGYVSLHQYISPTEIANVFKVTQSAKARIDQPGTFIAFILDRSGSMAAVDILDAKNSNILSSAYIDRRAAVKRAIEAALEQFFVANAAGNVDIHKVFVNITSEDVSAAAVTAGAWGSGGVTFDATGKMTENAANLASSGHVGGFVPLVDPLKANVAVPSYPTDLNPVITTALSNYTTLGTSWSFMDDSFEYTYECLRDALLESGGASGLAHNWVPGTVPDTRLQSINAEDASKFILVMGDGDPHGDLATGQNYLFAAKTPATYDADGKLVPLAAQAYGQNYGLDAVVWSSVFGNDGGHNKNWAADALQLNGQWLNNWSWSSTPSAYRVPYWYAVSTAGGQTSNYRVVEPFMILSAYTPNNILTASGYSSSLNTGSYWGLLSGVSPTYTKGTYASTSTAYWTEADYFVNIYNDMVLDHGSSPLSSAYNYYWVSHTGGDFTNIKMTDSAGVGSMTNTERKDLGSNDAEVVFKSFALASMNSISNSVNTNLNTDKFELYHFPGKPLLDLSSDDSQTNQTATAIGTTGVNWNIGTMRDGCTYTLIFYIKMDENASADNYFSFGDATFSSGGSSLSFPPVYVSGSGATSSGDQGSSSSSDGSAMSHDTTNNTSAESGSGLIPIVGSVNATAYTPSVTPSGIQAENLEEKAEAIPVTRTNNAAIIWLACIALGAATIGVIAMRKKKEDQ